MRRPLMSAAMLAIALGCQGRWQSTPSATRSVGRQGNGGLTPTVLLSGLSSAGFAQATGPRRFSFPEDHGPHPAFRTEWWYFTGILQTRSPPAPGRDAGAVPARPRRFGYQFTVFRQALASDTAVRDSAWASRDSYMAHLAVADIDLGDGNTDDRDGRRFHAGQRFAREGLDLAGARLHPFEVWVESWRMSGGADLFPVTLRAGQAHPKSDPSRSRRDHSVQAQEMGIDLSVAAGRGPILQGDGGWSVKGAGAGNASYYYSCTRLPTTGRLTVGHQTFEVTGLSWLDREWSTSALGGEIVGWDWLGIHLDDGRDVMLYRLRSRGGGTAPASRATVIEADGSTRLFASDAFSLTAQGVWESGDHRARYPAAFLLTIPAAGIELTIRPLLADQELKLAVRYWEGAVAAQGRQTSSEPPLSGSGYLELTGYAEPSPSPSATLPARKVVPADNCVDNHPLPTAR